MPSYISAEQILTSHYDPLQFLIGPKLLPRAGRMLLTGENGTGKSAFLLYASACLITGTPLFGLTCKKKDATFGQPVFPVLGQNKVLYVDYEIPHAIRKTLRLAPLTQSFGVEFAKALYFVSNPSTVNLDTAEQFTELYSMVNELRPNVLIIDPLSSAHYREENTSQIRSVLKQADKLIDAYGCAVIVCHHTSTKNSGSFVEKGSKEKARGHSSITDWCDFNLLLTDRTVNNKRVKTLELDFAKTRYNHALHKRNIEVDIEKMTFLEGSATYEDDDE